MAKLIDRTPRHWHGYYKRVRNPLHLLREEGKYYVLGINHHNSPHPNPALGNIQDKSFAPVATLIYHQREWYLGNLGKEEADTALATGWLSRYSPLPSLLFSSYFGEHLRRTCGSLDFERAFYSPEIRLWNPQGVDIPVGFDELAFKRDHLFNRFILEQGNIDRLIEQSLLKQLHHRDYIEIYKNHRLQFKKSLAELLS